MHEVAAVYLDGGPSKQNEGAGRVGQRKARPRRVCSGAGYHTPELGNVACSCSGPCEEPCGTHLSTVSLDEAGAII